MDPEDLNSNERKLFSELKTEAELPEWLENKTIESLRKNNLLSSKKQNVRNLLRLPIAAAIVAAVFAAGLIYGRNTSANNGPSYTQNTYVFFLKEGPKYESPSGETEEMQRVNEYGKWAIQLRKEGIPVSGVKLRDQATLLNDVAKSDFESNMVRGYFLIDAPTKEKAIEIAKTCPHLKYGGTLEVRQIHPV